MKDNTKLIEDLLKVVKYLQEEHVGSVPDIMLGYNKYPSNVDDMLYYKQLQYTLIKMGLAKEQSERLNGFYDLNLTEKGYSTVTIKSESVTTKKESETSRDRASRKRFIEANKPQSNSIFDYMGYKPTQKSKWYNDATKLALYSFIVAVFVSIVQLCDSEFATRVVDYIKAFFS